MRKLFKERKLFKGGNYVRKYGKYISKNSGSKKMFTKTCNVLVFSCFDVYLANTESL